MYINGEWRKTEKTMPVINPATGEVVHEVCLGGRKEIQDAIAAAKQAFGAWSKQTALSRANTMLAVCAMLEKKKQVLAEMVTMEMGKPVKDALGEVQSAIDYFRWFAEEARRMDGAVIPASATDKRMLVIKQPVGVVGMITPWNFPLAMVARKMAPALAAGCTLILKPASQTPKTAIDFFKVCEEAGFPKGVINLIVASSQEVSEEFMASSDVRKITFTGSTEVGKSLIAGSANTVKRVSMELGGHAPYIVMADADIDLAVEGILLTKIRCSGQVCTASNRVYVHKSIVQEFTNRLQEVIKTVRVGNGMDPATTIGPLVNLEAVQKVTEQVEDAVKKGAKLLCGGQRLMQGEYTKGAFFPPTILTGVTPNMIIHQEETFGPVVPILVFETEEELMAMANSSQYGLASYVFTNDLSTMIRIVEGLEFGMVGVNDPRPFAVQAPFGGVKESGVGREGGHQGLDDFLETKMMCIRFKQ